MGSWPAELPSGTLPPPHSEWGAQRLEVSHVHKVECVIPWLNDALVFFTVSLQLCQQLKDKVGTWGRSGPGWASRRLGQPNSRLFSPFFFGAAHL